VTDLSTPEIVIASFSVLGFLLFYSSPTLIALALRRQSDERSLGSIAVPKGEGKTREAKALVARLSAVRRKAVLAEYFGEEFADPKHLTTVYRLSVYFGLAFLSDLAAALCGALSLAVKEVPIEPFVFSVSTGLVIVGVVLAMLSQRSLILGAEERLKQANDSAQVETISFLEGVADGDGSSQLQPPTLPD